MPTPDLNKWEKEAEAFLERLIRHGKKNVQKDYQKMKKDLAIVLSAIYIRLDDDVITKGVQKQIRQAVEGVVAKHQEKILKEVRKTSEGAAAVGYRGFQYVAEQQNRIGLPLPKQGDVVEKHVLKRLGDGKNYVDRIVRVNGDVIDTLSGTISPPTDKWNWTLHIEDQVNQSVDRAEKRAIRIQDAEARRTKEEATEAARIEGDILGYVTVKTWITRGDHRVRDTHVALHGITLATSEHFETPKGRTLSPRLFGIPSEDINCRCVLTEEAIEIRDQSDLRRLFVNGKTDFTNWMRERDEFVALYGKDTDLFRVSITKIK